VNYAVRIGHEAEKSLTVSTELPSVASVTELSNSPGIRLTPASLRLLWNAPASANHGWVAGAFSSLSIAMPQ
jgi:hypothetical protein